MLDFLKEGTLVLSGIVEASAAVVVAFAVIEALLRAARLVVRPPHSDMHGRENVRLRLGQWLSLALEFELAADILRTAVAPSWDEIGKLAAIAALRTALNFFLQRELDTAIRREQQTPASSTDAPLPTG